MKPYIYRLPSFFGAPFLLGALFAEISVFILVGQAIGVFPTIGLIALSMLGGVLLFQTQSLSLFYKIKSQLQQGALPKQEFRHNFFMLFAAILLILPGFISDIFALALCVPFIRNWVWKKLKQHFTSHYSPNRNKKNTQEEYIDLDKGEYYSKKPSKKHIDHDGPRT